MSSLSQFDANAERDARLNYQNEYNNEIMNNQNLLEQRKEELKQRVNNLIEPLGQEILRASGERLIKQYGLKKYYDALRTGDTESLVKSLSDDLGKRAKSIVAGQSDEALGRLGLKPEEISSLKKGLNDGDFSGIATSKLTDLFNRAKKIARSQDVDKALDKLNVSKQDKADLPTSFLRDGEKVSALNESAVGKMTEKLSSLTGDAKQEFLDKTGGNVPSSDELAEHMQDLDIPEANVLTPVDLDRPFKGLGSQADFSNRETEGEVANPAFNLDNEATPLWSASSAFDEEQEAINQFLANKSKNIADYAGTSGGASSRAFEELRNQPTSEPKDLGLPADQEPKLLGGLGGEGIPFDANVDYSANPLNVASNTGGLVSRMINYFTGKSKPQEVKEEEEEEPVIPQTTSRGDLIFDTSSLKALGIQQAEQFPQDVNTNTYRALLRGEESRLFQPVEQVGGFKTRDEQVPSAFNWTQEASQAGANRVLSEARRIEQKVSAASLPKPTKVRTREEPDLGSVSGTYRRGNLEIPSTAPPLPQPSDAEASTPLNVVNPEDLVTLQPITRTPQGEPIPPSLTQPQDTTAAQTAEDQRLSAGFQGGALAQQALKKARQFYKSRKQRNGEEQEPKEEQPQEEPPAEPTPQETAPSAGEDPPVDPTPPPSQPAEEAPAETSAETSAETAAESTAEKATTEATETATEAGEGATEAAVEGGTAAAAEGGTDAAAAAAAAAGAGGDIAAGGALAGAGAALDATGVLAPLGILLGLGGILAGSGVFNKKPPTPPSAASVADNPEKYGIQVAPQETTISQEVGGGNV